MNQGAYAPGKDWTCPSSSSFNVRAAMKAATLRGPHKVGPRDMHTQQIPWSGPGNFGKEYCIPGFNESGQDRLFASFMLKLL